MLRQEQPLYDKEQTAETIKNFTAKYYNDIENYLINGKRPSQMSLQEFFDFVRLIPYRRDSSPVEVVSRPSYIINHRNLGMDCKKKSVLMGAYCTLHNIPFRFCGSSTRLDKKIHHIFIQVFIKGLWKFADATYSDYKLFQDKPFITSMIVF
jgi:hypothetical protein